MIYNADKALYDTPEQEAKRAAVLKLLKHLKSKNTPIQALGVQAHLNADNHLKKLFNHQKFSQFLTDVANLGFKIVISELDVQDRTLPADLKTRDRLVAQIYNDFLSVALKEPAVTTVTSWGLSDIAIPGLTGLTREKISYHQDLYPMIGNLNQKMLVKL